MNRIPHTTAPGSLPVGRILATLVYIVVTFISLSADRRFIIDNDNYLQYFQSDWIDYIADIFNNIDHDNLITLSPIISEEIGWLSIIEILKSFLEPDYAVVSIIFFISLFILISSLRFRNSAWALFLWFALPVGFSVVGYFQLRQGLGLSIFYLFLTLGSMGLLGLIVASLVHTTFIIPAFFWTLALVSSRPVLGLCLQTAVAAVAPVAAAGLFADVAGRRADTYQVDDGATSPLFVAGAIILLLPFLAIILGKRDRHIIDDVVSNRYIMMYYGVSAFQIVSFFVFPLGTSRIGYFQFLLAIPLFASLNHYYIFRNSGKYWFLVATIVLAYSYAVYQIGKSVYDGRYYCITVGC